MKQKEWSKRLRDRLADHQEPVSDDLWSRIEASLPPQRQQKSRIIPIMRWVVAASFLALALGGSYLMWQGKDNTFHETTSAIMPHINFPQTTKHNDIQPNSHNITRARVAHPILSSEAINHIHSRQRRDSIEIMEKQGNLDNLEKIENLEFLDKTEAQNSPNTLHSPTLHRQSISHHIAINLYASNNISQMNGSRPVAIGGEMAQAYYGADESLQSNQGKRLSPIYLANYSESKKHYIPLALGLTVSYPLNDKLSVSSGLVYTRLRSDFTFTMNDNYIKKEQLLHYIGIPLSIHYLWWKYKNFHTYLSLGGQIDWNIKANVKTENTSTTIDKDHCRWSVNGSLGIGYSIIPQLSLYAEPGVKHYFNNDSKIDNIFKDKPTQLNIELGLRLHLPK